MMRLTIMFVGIAAAGCGEPVPVFDQAQVLGGKQVSAATLNSGARIYGLRCASCHGNDGDGKGPGSSGFQHPPRDFRAADFKYTSTPQGALPTDSDLVAVVREGKVSNGMPAWPGMPAKDRLAVVQYIKTFSVRWTQPQAEQL